MCDRTFLQAAGMWWVVALVMLMTTGCGDRYNFQRSSYDRGTLGEELFAIWQKDAARARHNPRAKVQMLGRQRADFVRAVDTMAPRDQLGEVDMFIQRILPMVDRGLLPSTTRKTRIALRDVSDDREWLEAMTSQRGPALDTLSSPSIEPRWTDHWVSYSRLEPLLMESTAFVLARDGLDSRTPDIEPQSESFYNMQRLLVDRLREVERARESSSASSSGASTTESSSGMLFQELMLTGDDRMSPRSSEEGREPLLVVRLGARGYPRVRSTGGEVVGPFRDDNDDGLADLDDEGRYQLRGERSAADVPAFAGDAELDGIRRDEQGRALAGDTPLFEYVDLRKTGLGFATRGLRDVHRQRLIWPMLDGLPAALDETSASDDWGDYRGYEPAPELSTLIDETMALLDASILPELAESFAEMLDGHAGTVAEVREATERFATAVEEHPDAQLDEDSTIGYDLMPLLAEIAADPQLWSDVMEALRDPVFRKFDESFVTLLTYRDTDVVPPRGGQYDRCFQACRSRYRAQETEDHPNGIGLVERYECIRNCPTDQLFSSRTQFDAPESKRNRSLAQRLLHLLRDATGAPYTIEIVDSQALGLLDNLPPIAELPGGEGGVGGGEAFVRSIAGNLKLENYTKGSYDDVSRIAELFNAGSLVELLGTFTELMGARLDPRPTPSQVTRFFNKEDIKLRCDQLEKISDLVSDDLLGLVCDNNDSTFADISDPTCHDGWKYSNHHSDMLYASEASGLIDSIQPLAKAFSDHGRETLLLEFFIVIHDHYSSRDDLYVQKDGSPSPMKGANFVSYEPVLLEAVQKGYPVDAIHQLAVTVDQMPSVDGTSFEEYLRRLVLHATEPGGAEADESFELPDGDTVRQPSRLHTFVSALSAMSNRLDKRPDARDALDKTVTSLDELFLATTRDDSGLFQFRRSGTLALASRGLRMFADEARTWRERDQLQPRLGEQWPDELESAIESRTFAHVVSLLEGLRQSESRRELMEHALSHLLETRRGRDGLVMFLYKLFVRTERTESFAPIADMIASLLDPNRTWEVEQYRDYPLASHLALLTRRLLQRDESGTGFEMLRRGLARTESGDRPVATLGDIGAQYFRVDPNDTSSLDPDDYERIYDMFALWFEDEAYGLEQFYDIVAQRRGAGEGDQPPSHTP